VYRENFTFTSAKFQSITLHKGFTHSIVHSFFQNKFARHRGLVLPLSISTILSIPLQHYTSKLSRQYCHRVTVLPPGDNPIAVNKYYYNIISDVLSEVSKFQQHNKPTRDNTGIKTVCVGCTERTLVVSIFRYSFVCLRCVVPVSMHYRLYLETVSTKVACVWNVMANAQKPDFVFRRNGRVHLNRRGCQFSRLLAAEVCASAVVMLDTPCPEVVRRVLAIHSIRQFPLHFPSRASPCAITFQLDSTAKWKICQIFRGQTVGARLAVASVTKTVTLLHVSRAAVSKVMTANINHGKTSSVKRNSGRKPKLSKGIAVLWRGSCLKIIKLLQQRWQQNSTFTWRPCPPPPPKQSPTRVSQIPHPWYSCNCVSSDYCKQG
jgi:hypothetical protein